MAIDVLMAMGQRAAQDVSITLGQPPPWLQLVQASAGIATTVGVLIALYVAAVREPRRSAEDRRHHMAQMTALHRAEAERVAAQARKVVPTCVRTPMFGDSSWTVRIDNASNAVTTISSVVVTAVDANGVDVPLACRPVGDTLAVDEVFDRSLRAALVDMSHGGFERRLVPAFKHAIRDALVGHFVAEWSRTLAPNQHAVMAYTTEHPKDQLRVAVEFEDETGYRWRRSDTGAPTRAIPVAPE